VTKILIIEDQAIFQNLYQSVLEKQDWTILQARDGEEGLNLARAHQPDVIILDMMLPRMDGLTFLRTYEPAKRPQTKIIVLSNADVPELKSNALKLGVFGYYVKATYFTPKQLLGIVDEALALSPDAAKAPGD
jgi:DNA-binding response OmpR family regulator